jgi:hypothetical protein
MAYNATYAPSDLPNVATDVIGEGGVQFKVYMPLFILGFAALLIAGIVVKVKRAF